MRFCNAFWQLSVLMTARFTLCKMMEWKLQQMSVPKQASLLQILPIQQLLSLMIVGREDRMAFVLWNKTLHLKYIPPACLGIKILASATCTKKVSSGNDRQLFWPANALLSHKQTEESVSIAAHHIQLTEQRVFVETHSKEKIVARVRFRTVLRY